MWIENLGERSETAKAKAKIRPFLLNTLIPIVPTVPRFDQLIESIE